ncbi:cytochrome P450 4c21-like [Danaus plexippus]|uniref:cytochrome P450 4c21-like n=1 Tax=Danaus plexippus TaxID=13037 RepID=UPI002AB20129|nr:cytochrome P450 4c21-like [Danaus plexippus]XP_061379366.1 cytochrome P450 4c21-like [Danaus plexippus]
MILSLFLFVCFIYILSFSINCRTRLMLKHLPSYTQIPFLGSMHKFINISGKKIMQRIEELSKISDEQGLPFVVWFAYLPVIIISNPDDAKAVAQTFVEKPYFYNFGKMWLGNGLVTAPAAVWKENIKKIGGTFTRSVVNSYQEVYNAQARRLVEELRAHVDKPPFESMHCIAHRTLETICQTGLGFTDFTDNIVTQEYYDAFNRSLELILLRGFNIIYHCDWLYRLSSGYAEMKKQVAVLNSVSDAIIKKKLQQRQKEKNRNHSNESIQGGKSSFKSFLDILLDLSENDPTLTEYQIVSEVNTLIVGGQETVAVTLFFAFLMIGCHPDVEEKLHAEIMNILGDKPDVDKDDLSRMVYCEAVIYETLRMFPPIPTVMRYADRDLKLDSYTIPRGTTVVLNAWGSGRSESLWGKQASHFRPERWLYGEPCMSSCLAFSVSRRSCIGRSYAKAILKTMLAHCVREFRFNSDAKNLNIKMDLVLRPISGHLLEVELRNDSH